VWKACRDYSSSGGEMHLNFVCGVVFFLGKDVMDKKSLGVARHIMIRNFICVQVAFHHIISFVFVLIVVILLFFAAPH
jgi:hypothetical protein